MKKTEISELAKQAKSAEELVALAEGKGYALTVKEAESYLASGELSDGDLDAVAGGTYYATPVDPLIVDTSKMGSPSYEKQRSTATPIPKIETPVVKPGKTTRRF